MFLPAGKQEAKPDVQELGSVATPEIVPVRTRSDLREFINLPWKIYGDNPYWVPPLKKVIRHLLDVKRHPFWKFSQQALFLARRGSETVGRIAGIIDRNFNRYHAVGAGAWGFFECVDDQEVASALFDSVEKWTCNHGMTELRGPFNPSTNYEIGLLVEGFDQPPAIMMTYNPPYYQRLVEGAGFHKEKDLVSFVGFRDGYNPPDWMLRMVERAMENGRIRIQQAQKKKRREALALTRKLYDECWSKNWGYVPMTDEEFDLTGKNLERIGEWDMFFFVYWDDEPVAFALMVPDINPLLKRFNGKIGLLGWLKYLLYRKEVQGVRGLLFGVKEQYRGRGVPFLALNHTIEILRRRGFSRIELGWNLEENEDINQLEEHLGGRIAKRYRVNRQWFADRW